MFKAILKSFVANIFFFNFFFINIASNIFKYLRLVSQKKKGHITGHVGLKPKTVQCYNPSNIFARAKLF